jgi:hypothetical protein
MADKRISDLREVTAPKITDFIPIVNNDETKKVALDNLVAQSTYSLAKINSLVSQITLNPSDNVPVITSAGNLRRISGNVFATKSDITPITVFQNTSSNYIAQNGNTLGQNLQIGTNDNFHFSLETGGSTRAIILSSGNFGIGITDPGATLEVGGNFFVRGLPINSLSFITPGQIAVKGNIDNSPLITFHDTVGTRQGYIQFGESATRIRSEKNSNLFLGTNSQDNLTILQNGNIAVSNNLSVAGILSAANLTGSTLLAANAQRQIVSVPTSQSVIFVPINFDTRSNANPNIASWSTNGNTSSSAWWSGEQVVNLINAPANAIAVLANFFVNTNPVLNSGQRVYAYRASEANAVGRPSTSTSPQNISTAQLNAINSAFVKSVMDPTGGPGQFEAEHTECHPIYFDTATKRFNWFWVDAKNGGAPTSAPFYSLDIRILGYYVIPS